MKKVQSKLRPTEIGVIKTFSLSPDDEVGEIGIEDLVAIGIEGVHRERF